MDVALARTFLAVIETGSFLDAAQRVFVTQSTVSARIKTLEEQLGATLFERSKAGATLTPSGLLFQKHAQTFVRAWEHARLEIALPEGFEIALTVGGQYSLWEGYLLQWLGHMRRDNPAIAIKAQMGFSDELMQSLIDGTLDIAVMYTPQGRAGFEVEMLFEDELILVSQEKHNTTIPPDNYILIDWGPEFLADHALNFPQISKPGTYLELGSLSLKYLMQTNSSGYVPRRLVRDHLRSGALHTVRRAPVFSYPAYAVFPGGDETGFTEIMLKELRRTAQDVTNKKIS